jgi:hypothetical protein
MKRYFASEDFLAKKAAIASFVDEHNEIRRYTESIHSEGAFSVGASSTGQHARLATFENTSRHRYQRERNTANYGETSTHNCSLQVVRNAKTDPVKYLMKYFNINADETTLADVEKLSESINRLENAIKNLEQRRESITVAANPPRFIQKRYMRRFMEHIGVQVESIMVPYPKYRFEYVSAGGNSSQRTEITLNAETIDALVDALGQKIKFQKSAAGQRALMTAKLRQFIKQRDNHACRICSVALTDEPHLLLEVDHIMPVSRGGLTTEENLQTLCWRCNRSKSNKVVVS